MELEIIMENLDRLEELRQFRMLDVKQERECYQIMDRLRWLEDIRALEIRKGIDMKIIAETHHYGFLTIEDKDIKDGLYDVGLQTAKDGRIWLCVDGKAWIRFKPMNQQPAREERYEKR